MHPDDEMLAALAAAGALTDDERHAFEERLGSDPELAVEYALAQESAMVMFEAVSERPPERLRAAVLSAIASTDQLPRRPIEGAPTSVETTSAAAATGVEPERAEGDDTERGNVVPLAGRSSRRRWMLPATAAAAVVVLLAGVLILRPNADAPNDPVAAVVNDDSAQQFVLAGDVAGFTVYRSSAHDASVIVGTGIDVEGLTPDEVLQLWAILDGVPTSMGTFTPTDSGEVSVVMEGVVEPLDVVYAITVEPAGGSEQPTTDPIAVSP